MRSIVLLQFMCQPSYRLQPNSWRLMVNLPTKTKSELNTRRSFLEVKLEDGDRSSLPRRKVLNFSLMIVLPKRIVSPHLHMHSIAHTRIVIYWWKIFVNVLPEGKLHYWFARIIMIKLIKWVPLSVNYGHKQTDCFLMLWAESWHQFITFRNSSICGHLVWIFT